jgi:hypothetical protein
LHAVQNGFSNANQIFEHRHHWCKRWLRLLVIFASFYRSSIANSTSLNISGVLWSDGFESTVTTHSRLFSKTCQLPLPPLTNSSSGSGRTECSDGWMHTKMVWLLKMHRCVSKPSARGNIHRTDEFLKGWQRPSTTDHLYKLMYFQIRHILCQLANFAGKKKSSHSVSMQSKIGLVILFRSSKERFWPWE